MGIPDFLILSVDANGLISLWDDQESRARGKQLHEVNVELALTTNQVRELEGAVIKAMSKPQGIAVINGLVLVDRDTKKALTFGQQVTAQDGEKFYLHAVEGPRHSGSTGRVYVSKSPVNDPSTNASYYPSVINAQWMPEGVYERSQK